VRELEPPSTDEGWDAVERVVFERVPRAGAAGVLVAAAALAADGWRAAIADRTAPHLVFDWRPGADATELDEAVDRLAGDVSAPVDAAVCPHDGGPPRCWCRPPLPGLPLAFARTHGVDLSRSTLVGCRPVHRALAAALGCRYVEV
jgi:hypothetical protein